MEQHEKNKQFIINYYNEMATNVPKTRQFLEQFINDEELIAHIQYFDVVFPGYNVFIDEITAEGNRVIVQARVQGIHKGNFAGISPTFKEVNFGAVIQYEIEDNKIVRHWMLSDQMTMMQQLGVIPAAQTAN